MDLLLKHRSLSLVTTLIVPLLLALPAGALADTIHLEVSPSNPPRGGSMTITASGLASSTGDGISIASLPSGEICPQTYPGIEAETLKHWTAPIPMFAVATVPTYSTSFLFLESSGSVCGYLTHTTVHFNNQDEVISVEEVTLAFTELPIVYGPSEKEKVESAIREEARERERKEHEREQKEQEEAAHRKYEEEAPARKAAAEAAEAQAKQAVEAGEAYAHQAAAAKARELAEQASVSLLRVKAVAHPGDSASNPGHTSIVRHDKYLCPRDDHSHDSEPTSRNLPLPSAGEWRR